MQGNISFTGDLSGSITGEGGGGVPHITATASVDPNTGIPEVSVSRSGTDENPNFAFAFKNLKGSQGVQGLPGQNGLNGVDGVDGEDGVSPVIFVTDITGGHRVKIIDVDHPLGQTFDVMNGINGQNGADGSDGSDGADGYSPVITITDITGGHRVNITDEEHPSGQNFDVMNGQNGQQGEQGVQGEPGVGVPAGGSIGQVLSKITTMDYQTGWTDLSGDDVAYDSNDSVNDKITEISSNLANKVGNESNSEMKMKIGTINTSSSLTFTAQIAFLITFGTGGQQGVYGCRSGTIQDIITAGSSISHSVSGTTYTFNNTSASVGARYLLAYI